jgi:dTDP-4-amino-4,6-dideoxygalactose transaminase
MHKQKIFIKYNIFKKKILIAEFLSKNGFYIPAGINILKKEMKYIANSINEIIKIS